MATLDRDKIDSGGPVSGFKGVFLWVACLVSLVGQPVHAQSPAPDNSSAPSPIFLPSLTIIGNTPLPGSGVDLDKVPSNVQTLSSSSLQRDGEDDLVPAAAARRLSSVNLNAEQGSQFQPDFVYRGFEASPISGVPQGIAVYQNGVRINEAFGDTVNWDLIPQFAVNQMTLQSNNPVFGLNALGGAVTLEMKNGFNFHGTDVQASGGSFGNISGFAEEGAQYGDFGIYAALGGTHDDGFRYHSPTGITQGYVDLGWEKDEFAVHLSVSAADNNLGALGPTPIQMLDADPKSVFTYPQAMTNEATLVQLTASYRPNDSVLLGGDIYYRHFHQSLIDGNTTDVTVCKPPHASFFCLEGSGTYPQDVLYDSHGDKVKVSALPLPPGAAYGEIDYSTTDTNTVGAGLQAKFTNPVGSHDNNFVVGLTVDHSSTAYSAYGVLGALLPDLDVIPSDVIIDQGLSPTASPPIEQPVSITGTNDYFGAYATDTFDITPRLSATASGRFNLAEIGVTDRTGFASGLNGTHSYGHFNPGAGLTYKLTEDVTVYGGWSEANRAPTPAELSCSNPRNPCILDAFLVSDPPLKQVVSQTVEFGLRGHFATATVPGQFVWNLGAYRTDSANDILLLGTQINGFGYFDNAGTTRRQGIEAGLAWRWDKWLVTANYSFLDAIFLNSLTLSSNSPAADAGGFIYVKPGDHIPLMPAHRLVVDTEYSATPRWKIGADLRFVSSQYLIGDESNQEPQLPPYATLDLHTSYKVTDRITVFGQIDNLYGTKYYTYGTFTQLDGLPAKFNYLTDPRTLSPSPDRVFYGGVKVAF
jgi:iron complex outermembrane receptor protein